MSPGPNARLFIVFWNVRRQTHTLKTDTGNLELRVGQKKVPTGAEEIGYGYWERRERK